ncbi:MAG: hypothetical protein R2716_08520 [Microthrixaceae bacterium]
MTRRIWSTLTVGSAASVVALVLVQAAIAGRWLNEGADIQLHGYIGNAVFVLGLVLVAVAFLSRAPAWLRAASVLLALFLFAQTGLGYVGRESAEARSWHIPMGVATFGLAVACLTGSCSRSRPHGPRPVLA